MVFGKVVEIIGDEVISNVSMNGCLACFECNFCEHEWIVILGKNFVLASPSVNQWHLVNVRHCKLIWLRLSCCAGVGSSKS